MSMSFFYLHTQVSQSLKVVLIKLSTNLATILFPFFSSEIQCRIIVSSGLVTHDIYMIQYVVN